MVRRGLSYQICGVLTNSGQWGNHGTIQGVRLKIQLFEKTKIFTWSFLFISFSWEIYLYDREETKEESDNPKSAILYHYPRDLLENVILLRARHFASLYIASKSFFKEDKHSEATFITSTGCCKVWPLNKGRFLIIILVLIDLKNKKTSIIDKELKQSESYINALIEELEKCLFMLSSIKPKSISVIDLSLDALDLTEILTSYCEYFIDRSINFLTHNDQTARAFNQIRHLFQYLHPIHQWVVQNSQNEMVQKNSIIQSCVASFITSKGRNLNLIVLTSFFTKISFKKT